MSTFLKGVIHSRVMSACLVNTDHIVTISPLLGSMHPSAAAWLDDGTTVDLEVKWDDLVLICDADFKTRLGNARLVMAPQKTEVQP